MKMYFYYLFFTSALLVVDVKSDCDDYINCFTEFFQELFVKKNGTRKSINADSVAPKYIVLNDNGDNIDKILSDVTNLIKRLNSDVKEREVIKEENNKTKIYVQSYDFDDNKQNVAEETTENLKSDATTGSTALNNLINDYATTPSSVYNFSVIPIKSVVENEISEKDDISNYYDIDEDNSTDYPIIDYVDLYKDTTNEDVVYKATETPNNINNLAEHIRENEKDIDNIIEQSPIFVHDEVLTDLIKNVTNHTIRTCNGDKPTLSNAVLPWIATIFLKNDSETSQFEYFCDGALVSNRVVLTAARCVTNGNKTRNHEDFIVILGKTSLQMSSGNENILKVKGVKPHQNFTFKDGEVKNDLAVLILEDSVTVNDGISVACLKREEGTEEDSGEAVTTAWSLSGDLTLIYFDKEKSKACGSDNKVENTICATYGNDVALCPSYGGLYVSETADNHLYLQGLRYGNPLDRGICFTKDVTYTSLKSYNSWIEGHVKKNKD